MLLRGLGRWEGGREGGMGRLDGLDDRIGDEHSGRIVGVLALR